MCDKICLLLFIFSFFFFYRPFCFVRSIHVIRQNFLLSFSHRILYRESRHAHNEITKRYFNIKCWFKIKIIEISDRMMKILS